MEQMVHLGIHMQSINIFLERESKMIWNLLINHSGCAVEGIL